MTETKDSRPQAPPLPADAPHRPPQQGPQGPKGNEDVKTMGPSGLETEPRANTVVMNLTTVATGAMGFGFVAAAAAAPTGPMGAAAAAGVAAVVGGLAGAYAGQKLKLGEPDVLVRHPDGALYITVKFNPRAGHQLEHAIAEVQKFANERPKVLYLGIRRIDVPGHPYVLQWQRNAATDPFGPGQWMPGARLDPLKERSTIEAPSILVA